METRGGVFLRSPTWQLSLRGLMKKKNRLSNYQTDCITVYKDLVLLTKSCNIPSVLYDPLYEFEIKSSVVQNILELKVNWFS